MALRPSGYTATHNETSCRQGRVIYLRGQKRRLNPAEWQTKSAQLRRRSVATSPSQAIWWNSMMSPGASKHVNSPAVLSCSLGSLQGLHPRSPSPVHNMPPIQHIPWVMRLRGIGNSDISISNDNLLLRKIKVCQISGLWKIWKKKWYIAVLLQYHSLAFSPFLDIHSSRLQYLKYREKFKLENIHLKAFLQHFMSNCMCHEGKLG